MVKLIPIPSPAAGNTAENQAHYQRVVGSNLVREGGEDACSLNGMYYYPPRKSSNLIGQEYWGLFGVILCYIWSDITLVHLQVKNYVKFGTTSNLVFYFQSTKI